MNPKKLIRKVLPKQGIKLAEETYRKGRVYALQARHGFPAKELRVIAVTGTNGKTTTCCYINEVLKGGGYRTAMYTTAVIGMDGKSRLNKTHRTVPLTAELVSFLKQAKAAQVDFVILETTSMALHQHKTLGIPVEIAVMTNFTQDHLDYHKSMEKYAEAKARLFGLYANPKFCVLNRDDEWFDYFKKRSVGKVVTYGKAEKSTVRIGTMKLGNNGSVWAIREHGVTTELKTGIPGAFNVYNATAAVSVGKLLGLSTEQLQVGAAKLHNVPGRMEKVEAGQDFTVLVDYAHTPDALENVLKAARALTRQRVLLVFGATGDRDKVKRPLMGRIAAKHADMVYLTDDETYTEDPEAIREAVHEGIEAEKGTYTEIPDRREAIEKALASARTGDVVILAGIGHQDTRNMGGVQKPWLEAEIAEKLLKNLR
jgi:UDP-N-acetylmuramyl-tripeptide synthetase